MVQVELNNMYVHIGANNSINKIMNQIKTLRLPVH